VIYSVTDRPSFQYAQSCLQELRPAKRHNVVILVANKQDIVRNRVISEEGEFVFRDVGIQGSLTVNWG
jgi:Ras family